MAAKRLFQSAPPVKGAIGARHISVLGVGVSIRAPREGGDEGFDFGLGEIACFNPRPP